MRDKSERKNMFLQARKTVSLKGALREREASAQKERETKNLWSNVKRGA